ncbi:hypothetical protein L1987_58701 [Smallanthus sonchifolius]|uniref:Uncharacterized protein n=1 Tax=Smallanthus sonchifolius TaxID=185202 RepID=A0ACB9D3I9_9ASTR|nr:hypothetical protein L1987_58701 [Smallanthus sonchifolius]
MNSREGEHIDKVLYKNEDVSDTCIYRDTVYLFQITKNAKSPEKVVRFPYYNLIDKSVCFIMYSDLEFSLTKS